VASSDDFRSNQKTIDGVPRSVVDNRRPLVWSPAWALRPSMYEHVTEHSEQARASHTNVPRDVPRCGALSLLRKLLHYRARGSAKIVPSFCVCVGLGPVVTSSWCAVRCPRRRSLCVACVVQRPMPAAVAPRCCRRIFKQSAYACGKKSLRGAQADARGATQVIGRGEQAVARGAAR
jgi:hypothetical protein